MDAVGTQLRTLTGYSDVVCRNVKPLVREVVQKCDGSGPLHVQWMPVRRPYLDVTNCVFSCKIKQLTYLD